MHKLVGLIGIKRVDEQTIYRSFLKIRYIATETNEHLDESWKGLRVNGENEYQTRIQIPPPISIERIS